MVDLNPENKKVDLKYIFGSIILWFGAGIIGLIFIDFLMYDEFNSTGPLVSFLLIPLGIYLMKTSRYATSVGESYTSGMVYRSFNRP